MKKQFRKHSWGCRLTIVGIISMFVMQTIGSSAVLAQPTLKLLPGISEMVYPSALYTPMTLKGVVVDPQNPLSFDFLVHQGDEFQTEEQRKEISQQLIKYFLASFTVPENEQWVNLSPYEGDRIVPESFGNTEMGRDLLALDYVLKQLSSSLMFPDGDQGKMFWDEIYKKAFEKYGTTDIPVETFHKIWIVPKKAVVYEHEQTAFILDQELDVMLEKDYVARDKNVGANPSIRPDQGENMVSPLQDNLSTQIMRDIILPVVRDEVNHGERFSKLRQIYHSMILATWMKRKFKQALSDAQHPLAKAYLDQNKVAGVEHNEDGVNQAIWNQYVEAFKKGVYDFVREDYDEYMDEMIPRKYFSGGMFGSADHAMSEVLEVVGLEGQADAFALIAREGSKIHTVYVNLQQVQSSSDDAMRVDLEGNVFADLQNNVVLGNEFRGSQTAEMTEDSAMRIQIEEASFFEEYDQIAQEVILTKRSNTNQSFQLKVNGEIVEFKVAVNLSDEIASRIDPNLEIIEVYIQESEKNNVNFMFHYRRDNEDSEYWLDFVDVGGADFVIPGAYRQIFELMMKEAPLVKTLVTNFETMKVVNDLELNYGIQRNNLTHSQIAGLTKLGRLRSNNFLLMWSDAEYDTADSEFYSINLNLVPDISDQLIGLLNQSKEIEMAYFDAPEKVSISIPRQQSLRQKYDASRINQIRLELQEVRESVGRNGLESQANQKRLLSALDLQIEHLKDIADQAMNSDRVGGIDLNAAQLDLQLDNAGSAINFNINQQTIDTMNIQGFTPIIIDIKPAMNLHMLLGLKEKNGSYS